MLKHHPHTPAHLCLDDTPYFITGAIYEKQRLLQAAELKELVLRVIQENFQGFGWQLYHWVILDNHYHLLGQSRRGNDLAELFRRIHGGTSGAIHKATACELPVWWNYWDYCPRDAHDYAIRMNYVLYNPIKHGYVTNLQQYPFSSFHRAFAELGRARLAQQFQSYPHYKDLVLREAEDDNF